MKRLKLKKILAGVLILSFAITAVGCTQNNIKEDIENNVIENADDKENSEEANKEDKPDTETVENVEDTENTEQVATETVEMILYSKDVNTEEQVIVDKVEINKDLSLEEKLEVLASNLSEKAFDRLPINFVEIKEVDGKKIALFNLDEFEENSGDITIDKYQGTNWVNNYFAGSAGGSITEYALIETLLQKNYTEQWIDGVEFTYKNSKIEFDHVPALGEISYR